MHMQVSVSLWVYLCVWCVCVLRVCWPKQCGFSTSRLKNYSYGNEIRTHNRQVPNVYVVVCVCVCAFLWVCVYLCVCRWRQQFHRCYCCCCWQSTFSRQMDMAKKKGDQTDWQTSETNGRKLTFNWWWWKKMRGKKRGSKLRQRHGSRSTFAFAEGGGRELGWSVANTHKNTLALHIK